MTTQTVTEQVIEARVRRALLREGQVLCKPRGSCMRQELGDYFTADAHTGNPERWNCDLEQLAREYRVLRDGEVMTG